MTLSSGLVIKALCRLFLLARETEQFEKILSRRLVMGYSMNDLDYAARELNNRREKNAQRKGEELASRLIHNTRQGRGLWVLLLWPTWLLIFAFSGAFFTTGFAHWLAQGSPLPYLGFVGGGIYAVAWYQWSFTRRHPFWSVVFGYFGTTFFVMWTTEILGW
jgi:hypothetical protein